jgi:thiamine-monophosphate kinase
LENGCAFSDVFFHWQQTNTNWTDLKKSFISMNEDDFLATLFPLFSANSDQIVIPPGDDCAGLLLSEQSETLTLVTVDQLLENRHFVNQGTNALTPFQAGRKLMARNLSDIAAMGGSPKYCVVSSSFSRMDSPEWIQSFFKGLVELGRDYQTHVVGGDLARATGDSVFSLTLLGDIPRSEVCLRSSVRPGDELLVTGCFGDSLTTGHHWSFVPRCAEGRWLAQNDFATGMMDVSDGLFIDSRRLATASNCGLQIQADKIPLRNDATSIKSALQDGEDYELAFAVSPGRKQLLLDQWPFADVPLTHIGTFTNDADIQIFNTEAMSSTELSEANNWDHLALR